MATREAKIRLTLEDDTSGKLGAVEAKGESFTKKLGGAFAKAGQAIGGEFGEIVEKVQEGLESVGESSNKLEKTGMVLSGVGATLIGIGEHEKVATQQLDQAIQNTGHDVEEFEGQIEHTVTSMEKYGYTADKTKMALQELTQATHDPQKAIDMMGEAADLAAAKHISLEEAAASLGKLLGGKGTRILAEYGVQVVKNADGTSNWAKTNAELAKVIDGQADAATTGWTGKLKQLRAEIQDNVAELGQKYGPAIVAIGVTTTALGPIAKGAAGMIGRIGTSFKKSAVEAEGSAAAIVEADAEIAAGNSAAAASATRLGSSASAGKSGLLGLVGAAGEFAAIAAIVYFGGNQLKKVLGDDGGAVDQLNASFKTTTSALDQLSSALVNSKEPAEEIADAWAAQTLQAEGFVAKASRVGITLNDLKAGLLGNDDAFDGLIERWKKTGELSKSQYMGLLALRQGYVETRKRVDENKTSSDKLTSAWGQTAIKGQSLDSALKQLSTDFDRLNSKTIDAERADIAVKDAIANITKETIGNSRSLSDNTAKGRANLSAVLDAISAAQSHEQAILKQTGSTEKATAAFVADREALKQHLIALGFDRDAVQRLIDRYAKVPKLKATTIDLRDQASSKLKNLEARLSAVSGQNWIAHVGATGQIQWTVTGGKGGGLIRFEAGGTDFAPGGRTIVAERETEILDLPRGTSVTPLSRARFASSGARGADQGAVVALLQSILVEHKALRQDIAQRLDAPVLLDGQRVGLVQGRQASRYARGG